MCHEDHFIKAVESTSRPNRGWFRFSSRTARYASSNCQSLKEEEESGSNGQRPVAAGRSTLGYGKPVSSCRLLSSSLFFASRLPTIFLILCSRCIPTELSPPRS